MIVTTIHEVPGRRTLKTLGIARGAAIRTRHFGRSLLAFFRGLVGGELPGYTKVIAEAREQAFDRMVEDAQRMGANAILGVKFCSIEVVTHAAEVLAYGTAAIVEPEEEA